MLIWACFPSDNTPGDKLTKPKSMALQKDFSSSLWKLWRKSLSKFSHVPYDSTAVWRQEATARWTEELKLFPASSPLLCTAPPPGSTDCNHENVHVVCTQWTNVFHPPGSMFPKNLACLAHSAIVFSQQTIIPAQESPAGAESASTFSGCSPSTLLAKSLLHAGFLPL